jgi:hypothetical protein
MCYNTTCPLDFMDDLALHLDANGAAIGLEYHTAVPPGKSEV